ncbi:LPXTG cell wall anchor domain-containing protein [Candidatus Gracilibacteria bacterium]|nr:LPXTG cell wall anchor domain-containing protein [Candidatus Gracilibacteria bacterium]
MTRSPLIALVAVSLVFVSTVSAATTGTTTTGTTTTAPAVTTQSAEIPLLLSTVSVTDAMTVGLEFNQAIQIDSLRVRIIDQATNESVRIASITGSTTPRLAMIKTSTALTAGASYVLTITSALSTTEMTIKAGIDSIREFSVPVTLKGASLNAPSNPNAVIAASGSMTKPTTTQSGSASGSMTKPSDTEALPATGTPTTLLIILAAISAFALLFVRKRA